MMNACVFLIMSWAVRIDDRRWRIAARLASLAVFLFQLTTTLVAQSHFTSDIIFALAIACVSSEFARRYAVYVDANLP
jgi:hypothetical protein